MPNLTDSNILTQRKCESTYREISTTLCSGLCTRGESTTSPPEWGIFVATILEAIATENQKSFSHLM
ncbi:hypothetical protein X798_03350 [Onchocerca flexuosa]|uniref:Uncharacterized protein n=2 Tax=Onchocerca flexuosa TaxID=387005 RepID=A0A183I470_9BILA|nr:hypothetical protein X798_03350 [Onchocerca flexuosa]VDP17479.1 unnamed protein product [Onchocerca flexuosa]